MQPTGWPGVLLDPNPPSPETEDNYSLMFRKRYKPVIRVTVFVDGVAIEADAGEPAAAVLLRSGSVYARLNPVSAEPRAPYCMMGVCQECIAVVDGAGSVPTCQTPVRDGMRIEKQLGVRAIPDA